MSKNIKDVYVTTSLKRASAAKLAGCDIELAGNPDNSRECLFVASPCRPAQLAVSNYEDNHPLPARSFLNIYIELYHESQNFLRLSRELAGGRTNLKQHCS